MATEGGPDASDTGGTLINGRFRPTKRLGSGSFGEIFMGVGTNGEKVAIKFEKAGLRCPQLRHEYKVYRELSGSVGIGRVHHYGTYGSSNVMVMDLLGASLEDLFTRCGRRFSLKTTLKLADQLLERVDAIHSRHLIHRDIKPANFVMGTDTSELCYCIDFGLSKRFRNPHTLAHIPHRVGKSLTGTPRYASINNHLGIEQARRDDLEAIGYVLIYFLKGRLPWQGLKARNASRKYKMIMEKKQSTSINTLCAGCPKEFSEYLSYCRSLKFEASPNIKYLRQLFRDLYTNQGFPLNTFGDADWDWNRLTDGNPPASSSSANEGDGDRKNVNSKPYGMYGENQGGGGNSRPTSASKRPQTATTNVAQSGSVGIKIHTLTSFMLFLLINMFVLKRKKNKLYTPLSRYLNLTISQSYV
jgi:serine/threonine protein kinase